MELDSDISNSTIKQMVENVNNFSNINALSEIETLTLLSIAFDKAAKALEASKNIIYT